MPPSVLAPAPPRRPELRLLDPPPLRVADVALFYGERSGGIRTYVDSKLRWSRASRAIEHHVIVPGPRERHADGVHELPSLRVRAANGYRVPVGANALKVTLRRIEPDVVLLHDPFWAPLGATEVAHAVGARVVAVHHGSGELDAAGLPGPSRAYLPVIRAWLRRAYASADAIMSVVDPAPDCGRPASLPLRLGLDPAFCPQPHVTRGDHTLYVGRLAREKGVFRLLEAAAMSSDPWPLRFVGSGPAEDALATRADRLGIGLRVSFRSFVEDRGRLARAYAGARCVVMPGEHETFGLVGLEAAASGARVVACANAPSGRAAGNLVHSFRPGDTRGLADAIAAARAAEPDRAAASALAACHRWPSIFEAETAALGALAR